MPGASSDRELRLPCPDVRLPADYAARLEHLTARLSAALARREGGGRSALFGAGTEFVGHRPYRPGDDPRAIDWNLYARFERPFVKVLRREARERWRVWIDTSASMGVGPPGKLQRAAELAGALALLGLRRECEVELATLAPRAGGELRLERWRPGVLGALCAWLEGLRADAGDARAAATQLRAGGAARVFLLGDPFGLAPRALLSAVGRVRALHVLHLLAPLELSCPGDAALEWRDPESARRRALALDAPARAAYAAELEQTLEDWRQVARARGARHGAWSTLRPFEAILRAALSA